MLLLVGPHYGKEHWSEYWCLPFNPSKCEISFFSVDPHQANLQPNLLLLDSSHHFNPTQLFLGSPSTAPFSKHASSLKSSFSHVSRPYTVSVLPHGAPLRSPSSFCIKLSFGPFSLMLHPDGFLSVTSLTKLERLHRAATGAITGWLSSSPIPLLLSEVFYLPY